MKNETERIIFEEQYAANRLNAAKSTGPKTEERTRYDVFAADYIERPAPVDTLHTLFTLPTTPPNSHRGPDRRPQP